MFQKIRDAGLLLPGVLAVVVFAASVELGNWQMQRKAWKDAIVADIAKRSTGSPVVLPALDSVGQWRSAGNGDYSKVRMRGRFSHEFERYFYALHPRFGPGFHVYTPLVLSSSNVVWVNRGYVSEGVKAPQARREGQVAGEVEVVGLVRMPVKKGTFSPDNDISGNIWFWRDLKAMHASAFDPVKVRAFPFFVDALAEPAAPGGWPRSGVTDLKIFNRHLEYALTWYGLAATLLGVFSVFAWGRLRATTRS